ncbi:unnamed protein product, partial [Mesorhabditis spiculigera]
MSMREALPMIKGVRLADVDCDKAPQTAEEYLTQTDWNGWEALLFKKPIAEITEEQLAKFPDHKGTPPLPGVVFSWDRVQVENIFQVVVRTLVRMQKKAQKATLPLEERSDEEEEVEEAGQQGPARVEAAGPETDEGFTEDLKTDDSKADEAEAEEKVETAESNQDEPEEAKSKDNEVEGPESEHVMCASPSGSEEHQPSVPKKVKLDYHSNGSLTQFLSAITKKTSKADEEAAKRYTLCFDEEHQHWCYAVLLVLEHNRLHDVTAALRDFIRFLRLERSYLKYLVVDEEQRRTLHDKYSLFIVIAAEFFGQSDLADG